MNNLISTITGMNKTATLAKTDNATTATDITSAKNAIAKMVVSIGSATSLGKDKDISDKLKEINQKITHILASVLDLWLKYDWHGVEQDILIKKLTCYLLKKQTYH